ncbi:MAG TPA: hypothetical protein GX696_07415 [Pseudomonadaceae bacterium]|nr:hypothetical protein [Pseudomonadaceae bacterium]
MFAPQRRNTLPLSPPVIRNFRITAADGKTYNTKHYKLPAIIAVGYKVNSERAVQFRNRQSDSRNCQGPCRSEFEKYRIVQDRLFESDFDRMLKQIETIQKPEGGNE